MSLKLLRMCWDVLLFFVLCPFFLVANNNDIELLKKERPAQEFTSYYDKLIIRPFINGSSQDLDLKYFSAEDNESSKNIEYRPAIVTNLGMGFSYKWLGFSISAKGASVPDKSKFGESEYLDLQLFSYWRQVGLDFFFATYTGYYLDNCNDFDLSRGDPGSIRPDLKTNTIGFNLIYSFSKDYSLRSAYKQTETQERSSGSFMLMTSVKIFGIESNYSLVPPSEESSFLNDAGYRGGGYLTLGIAPGYGYTLRVWKINISGALFIGTGLMAINYEVDSGQKDKIQSYIKTNLKLSATLDGDRYFGGITAAFDRVASETFMVQPKGVSASVANNYIEVFLGHRFDIITD